MRLKTMFGLCLMALLLVSCATTGAGDASFCDVANRICIDPGEQLTDTTAQMLLEHNRTGAKLCGWKKCS